MPLSKKFSICTFGNGVDSAQDTIADVEAPLLCLLIVILPLLSSWRPTDFYVQACETQKTLERHSTHSRPL